MSRFYERIAELPPRKGTVYLGHLAEQIIGYGSESCRSQLRDAKVSGHEQDLVDAELRNKQLREKFMGLHRAYSESHFLLDTRVNDGILRTICDVLYDEQGRIN